MRLNDLPQEIYTRLEHYHALILKWQKRINLIAPSTVDQIWDRHFADSLGYCELIPKSCETIVDIGSGGGFPALVLALVKPDIQFSLVESDERKAIFLQTVSRETKLNNVTIYNDRAENILPQLESQDLIIARACASLVNLLEFQMMALRKNSHIKGVFAKGNNYSSELDAAKAQYNFNYNVAENTQNKGSYLVEVSNLRKMDCV